MRVVAEARKQPVDRLQRLQVAQDQAGHSGPGTPYWLIAGYIALFGFVRSARFMSLKTVSCADMSAEKLSRAASLGGVLQQLGVSFGVSAAAMMLALDRAMSSVEFAGTIC
ncbi:MAG TPA: hypothetical protein VFZ03_01105 [Dongiaceae bacterium]